MLEISSLFVCVSRDPYTAGQLVGRWHGSTSFHIQIPLKLNILFHFIPGSRDSGPFFFFPAEIADDGLASYHTSVKEENLMSGHV